MKFSVPGPVFNMEGQENMYSSAPGPVFHIEAQKNMEPIPHSPQPTLQFQTPQSTRSIIPDPVFQMQPTMQQFAAQNVSSANKAQHADARYECNVCGKTE